MCAFKFANNPKFIRDPFRVGFFFDVFQGLKPLAIVLRAFGAGLLQKYF